MMLSYQVLKKNLAEGKFAPVYLFYGEEKYLQEEMIDHLAQAFLDQDIDFGKEKLDGTLLTLDEIINRLGEFGLFSERRLIIVNNPLYLVPSRKNEDIDSAEAVGDKELSNKNDPEFLADYLEQNSSGVPDNILVFLVSRVDRRRRLYKLIADKGVSVECSPLKGEALVRWIQSKVDRLGKSIEGGALERLLLAGDQNLHYLSNELEKYSAYLGEGQNVITAKIVDHLFSGDIQGDIFKMTDAIAEGSLARAYDLLELLLGKREKPLQIFFMLTRHYRLLLKAHSLYNEGIAPAEFAALLEVHPYVARKLREQAAKCNGTMLEEVLIALQKADLQIKTGRTEPPQALKLILSRIDYLQSAVRCDTG